ncbi:MAG TPA: hypothetical protein VMU07_03475 [Candidatus Paceibacterota bacterium]|nr:hypothetical protein [Candidatus Paceibacterota bacterium]
MKKYWIDIVAGIEAAMACFIVAFIVAASTTRSFMLLAISMLVLLIISAILYLKSGYFKKNHENKFSVAGSMMFVLGVLIVMAIIMYLAFGSITLSIPG